jgi:hypothetical protein
MKYYWLNILMVIGLLGIFRVSTKLSVDADSTQISANHTKTPDIVDNTWWATIQKNILVQEYYLTWQNGDTTFTHTASAPNRAHQWRVYFAPDGIQIVPKSESISWKWNLALDGYGYLGDVRPVETATLTIEENRAIYLRSALDEWYINGENGLEQGFTLHQPPTGIQANQIVLELSLGGNLIPYWNDDTTQVELYAPDGNVILNFGKLFATDANQKTLPSSMELQGQRLRLVIETDGAVYPITVDPLATAANWSVESNQTAAQMGISVASAGDVNGDGFDDVLIGTHQYDSSFTNEGSVALYYGSATGIGATPDWVVYGGQANANLGISVASAGDVNGDGYSDILVGAEYYTAANAQEGAAYLWYGSPTVPSVSANWSATGGVANAFFGQSVASAGDVNGDGYSDILIGAYNYANGQSTEGAAFLWNGSPNGLSCGAGCPVAANTANWRVEGNQNNASLGFAVASAGDVNGDGYADILVGASGYTNPISMEGAAFLWYGSAHGIACGAGCPTTPASAAWNILGGQIGAAMGRSVASAGDVNGDGYDDILVGASSMDVGNTDEGIAYLWYGSASGPAAIADWNAQANQDGAYMGFSVASAGDVNNDGYSDIIIGASLYDNGEADEGAVFVWHGSASGMAANGIPDTNGLPDIGDEVWRIEGESNGAWLGYSAASAGDINGDGYSDVVVGAPLFSNPNNGEGQVRGYLSGVSGATLGIAWDAESNQVDARLGSSVSTAGDINGDGYSDVIVAAFLYDVGGLVDAGRVYIFLGSAEGLSDIPQRILDGTLANGYFGGAVSTAGDVNRDGYDDILIGAYGYNNTGRVYLYLGSASGIGATSVWTNDGTINSQFGVAVGAAGDVNGDGYGDIIVGARQYTNGQNNEGATYVFFGTVSPTTIQTTPWIVESNIADANLGCGVGGAGDVNGDGYADIIVGAFGYNTNEGAAFVWHGSASGLPGGTTGTLANANWQAGGNTTALDFGYSVSTAGDVNGDGYSDIIIGARGYDDGESNEGAAFVWLGSNNGVNQDVDGDASPTNTPPSPSAAHWRVESNLINAGMGYVLVGSSGDFNGDGYSDVVIPARRYSIGGYSENGRVFIWAGSATGINNGIYSSASDVVPNWYWSANGSQNAENLGVSTGTAGDINGDGFADLVIGGWGYMNGENQEGRAVLSYGHNTNGLGLNILPRQRRADDTADIGASGQAISPNSVQLSSWARGPFGRSNVRLQWELTPALAVGGTTVTGSSAWTDSTVSGTSISALINGLSFERYYRWRVRIQAQPLNAANANLVTYSGPWIYGNRFFTALSGQQPIASTGTTQLLGQTAYVNISSLGTTPLTGLTLRGYPNTAHPQENFRGGGNNFLDRYFTLTPNTGATGYNLALCLNYDPAEITIGTETDLRLCRWTGSGWDCLARSALSNPATDLVCADNVTAFSDWAIASQVGPTAVRLTSLQARNNVVQTTSLVLVVTLGISLMLIAFLRRKR